MTSSLCLTLVLLLAHASRLQSGLSIGEAVPSWEPVHVAGPDQGTQACPICTYGARPMILVVTHDGPNAAALAAKVEHLVAASSDKELKGFVVVTDSTPARLRRLAREQGIEKAALCYPEPGHEHTDLRLKLKINPRARNTIVVYRHFRVTASFVNVDGGSFDEVERAVRRTLE
jgi:protocatechuate 3,4-dioxygenase beta subunit